MGLESSGRLVGFISTKWRRKLARKIDGELLEKHVNTAQNTSLKPSLITWKSIDRFQRGASGASGAPAG